MKLHFGHKSCAKFYFWPQHSHFTLISSRNTHSTLKFNTKMPDTERKSNTQWSWSTAGNFDHRTPSFPLCIFAALSPESRGRRPAHVIRPRQPPPVQSNVDWPITACHVSKWTRRQTPSAATSVMLTVNDTPAPLRRRHVSIPSTSSHRQPYFRELQF